MRNSAPGRAFPHHSGSCPMPTPVPLTQCARQVSLSSVACTWCFSISPFPGLLHLNRLCHPFQHGTCGSLWDQGESRAGWALECSVGLHISRGRRVLALPSTKSSSWLSVGRCTKGLAPVGSAEHPRDPSHSLTGADPPAQILTCLLEALRSCQPPRPSLNSCHAATCGSLGTSAESCPSPLPEYLPHP